MNNSQHLFVYGSLRSGFKSPAYQYISQYFDLESVATAKGILYDMGNFPVATSTSNESYIVGELYKIKDVAALDFIIAQLDDYEGLNNGEDDEICLYERKLIDVYIENKVAAKAHVYWYCGDVKNKTVVTSGDVMEYFKEKTKN